MMTTPIPQAGPYTPDPAHWEAFVQDASLDLTTTASRVVHHVDQAANHPTWISAQGAAAGCTQVWQAITGLADPEEAIDLARWITDRPAHLVAAVVPL